MSLQVLNSWIDSFDVLLEEELLMILNDFIKNNEAETKEIKLPDSLSTNQLDCLVKTVLEATNVELKVDWFFPTANVSIMRPLQVEDFMKKSPIRINLPSLCREQLLKFSSNKCKHTRINEQFRSDFNLFTYFDTKPIIPKTIQRQICDNYSSISAEQTPDKIQLLLEHLLLFPKQIQIISGLGKLEKLDFLIKINNDCCTKQTPCRIVYLQSLSIMTFWMALKAVEISNDKWNSIGYQITLESKTSLNNSIIFFEIATFIRVLNRDLDMSLITHLVIDVGQNHLFFNLLFLYLKENIQSLRHLRILILINDARQSSRIIDYFQPEVFYVNYAQDYKLNTSGSLNAMNSNLKYYYLPDIATNLGANKIPKIHITECIENMPSNNIEMIMIQCWQDKLEVFKLIEYFQLFPWQINYQCKRLNGITGLIVAVVKGQHADVYQLLALGADCRIASGNNMQPIQWAIEYDQQETFQLLFTHQYATHSSFDLDLSHSYLIKYSLTHSVWPKGFCFNSREDPKTPPSTSSSTSPIYNVDYELILNLLPNMVRQIYCYTNNYKTMKNRPSSCSSLGSILIMLPSYQNVSTLRKLIIATLSEFELEFTIFCLYPNVPNNELDAGIGILSAKSKQVRVILSTFNVSSILFRDIYFVINTGIRLEKTHSIFSDLNLYRLISNKSDDTETKNVLANQKIPVIIYNLFRKDDFSGHHFDENDSQSFDCQLSTDSMYHCIFAAKCFEFKNNKIMNIFDKMISKPEKQIISNALVYLKNINILDESEDLTEFGKILIDLTIEPHYAKMIIFSVILRCLDPILTIVCSLSSPNTFNQSLSSTSLNHNEGDIFSLNTAFQKNYSDHLIHVYAFQKWQEICRSNAKSNSIKLNPNENFSTFEMIYSLRTKILGQLRAIGFVKGKGSMNIRYLNANSDNFSLVKAAICAGQPFDHFVQTFSTSSNRCFGSNPEEIIYIDPNSVLNLHQKDSFNAKIPSSLVLFDRKINCGQISYIQNCTLINPLTMAIFADESITMTGTAKCHKDCMEINENFFFAGEEIEKIFNIRQRWQYFVRKRLFNMQQMVNDDDDNFMKDLIRLITHSDECLGFGSHPSIGRAPQVMSTYFCSTIRIKK